MQSKRGRNGSSEASRWQDPFVMWRRRCYTLQHQTGFSRHRLSSPHKGKTGQSGSQEQLLSCQLGRQGDVAWRVTPLRPVRVNPRVRWLPLPSLSPVCQVEKQGPGGQRLYAPSAGKGQHGGLVGPLRDDRGVRGPLGWGGVEPVEPLLKHSPACYPTLRKGRGSPSANWYYQGVHHLGAKHREAQPYTQRRRIWACVLMYMSLYDQTNTPTYKSTHTHTYTRARSVRMYPRTPIQCQCSVLSPPTSGWSPCQFTCQGWTSRALSAPERPPSPPPIHTHHVTQGQGGFTHAPVPSLPSIARCHPRTDSTAHVL